MEFYGWFIFLAFDIAWGVVFLHNTAAILKDRHKSTMRSY